MDRQEAARRCQCSNEPTAKMPTETHCSCSYLAVSQRRGGHVSRWKVRPITGGSSAFKLLRSSWHRFANLWLVSCADLSSLRSLLRHKRTRPGADQGGRNASYPACGRARGVRHGLRANACDVAPSIEWKDAPRQRSQPALLQRSSRVDERGGLYGAPGLVNMVECRVLARN
jgi:hypothetical protein